MNHLGILLKCRFLIQCVGGWARDSAFLTLSQGDADALWITLEEQEF